MAADIPTQADVIRHVIEERRREFFVEGGHRLRDHLRWRGTEFDIPFLGEPRFGPSGPRGPGWVFVRTDHLLPSAADRAVARNRRP